MLKKLNTYQKITIVISVIGAILVPVLMSFLNSKTEQEIGNNNQIAIQQKNINGSNIVNLGTEKSDRHLEEQTKKIINEQLSKKPAKVVIESYADIYNDKEASNLIKEIIDYLDSKSIKSEVRLLSMSPTPGCSKNLLLDGDSPDNILYIQVTSCK